MHTNTVLWYTHVYCADDPGMCTFLGCRVVHLHGYHGTYSTIHYRKKRYTCQKVYITSQCGLQYILSWCEGMHTCTKCTT
jgi:hypothetical protein